MPTLPNQSTANTDSAATLAALKAAADAAFIASTTVLINNAIAIGLYEVQPIIIPYMDIPTITTYFQGFGYTVLYPLVPTGPWSLCGPAAGFPEVIPPGWQSGFCNCQSGPARMQISWGP